MFLEGLRITQPALLQVTVLSKVRFAFSYPPTTQKRRLSSCVDVETACSFPFLSQLPLTAIAHHFIIRRRPIPAMWVSLAVLTFGLVLAGAPEALYDALWEPKLRKTLQVQDLLSGPAIGLTIGVLSGCASIFTELQLKQEVPFWTAQVRPGFLLSFLFFPTKLTSFYRFTSTPGAPSSPVSLVSLPLAPFFRPLPTLISHPNSLLSRSSRLYRLFFPRLPHPRSRHRLLRSPRCEHSSSAR
jgi:hypothetical protein